jgi:photosystem II stability/assembly factor-like uncharacterized protein
MNGSMSLRRLASVLLLAALAIRPAAAGIDRFTPTGPLNGDLATLVIDPSVPGSLLAMTISDGIFKSVDGGSTWAWSGAGIDGGPQGMIGDPSTPGSVYVLTDTKVFHSADGGMRWTQVAAGQNFSTPFTPHLHFLPRLTLLPGGPETPPTILWTGVQSVQRSGDGGVTWSTVFTSEFLSNNWEPVADPTDSRRVWLVPPGGGLMRSTDSGQSWAPVSSFPAPQLAAVLVLPTAPATILAASGSLYKSTDDGATWRALPMSVVPVAYEPQTPSFVYAFSNAFLVSADAGETWTPRKVPPPGSLLPVPGTRTLYAVGQNEISISLDRGRHWSLVTTSGQSPIPLLETAFPVRLRFQPGDPATAYAITGNRAFKSLDGGASWSIFAADPLLPSTAAQDLAIDPGDPAVLDLTTSQGVFRSADSGASWARTTPQSFLRLDFAGRTLLGASCGVERSTDGGLTWRVALPCPSPGSGSPRKIDRLTVDPRNPNVVYAAGFDVAPAGVAAPPRIWRSLDNGAVFKLLVPDGNMLAVDPTRSGRLYVARPAGLQRSDDNGRTFRTIASFPAGLGKDLSVLLVDSATSSTLYAASTTQGVWRSTNGGATWAPINAGLARYGDLEARDLVLHPTVPHLLYTSVATGFLEVSRLTEP